MCTIHKIIIAQRSSGIHFKEDQNSEKGQITMDSSNKLVEKTIRRENNPGRLGWDKRKAWRTIHKMIHEWNFRGVGYWVDHAGFQFSVMCTGQGMALHTICLLLTIPNYAANKISINNSRSIFDSMICRPLSLWDISVVTLAPSNNLRGKQIWGVCAGDSGK